MASVEDLLLNSLRELVKDELKLFKWHLKNQKHISKSEMKADILDTVDMMVARLRPEGAVKTTVNILRKMNQNNLAEQLKKKHKEVSLCDIKQRPERNNSDTHTAGFSQPKPSGLDIHPLLNCQSCVHIADSDQWLQIEPSACTDEGGSKFRVSTDPGRYECVRTRMRWVCDCVVTLQYRTVDGLFLNAELERLQCNRIGPVIDVTVISGKLEEVHLPHYACLGESDPSLKDAVKVLTVKDEGITTEPVQLTRFHAKIVQPSFSLTTLIISWIKRVEEHCDLLLYMRSKDPLILHLYLFPFDDHAKEKVERKEKRNDPIDYPRPDRPFRMKTPHILDVPGASIHPKEGITFTRETPPNFFKVNTSLENDLEMTLIRAEDQETVWTATIKKNDLIHPKRDEPRLNIQRPEPEDRRNASMSVEDQPIQSDWKRPHSITPSKQEFRDRILRENRNNVYIPKDKSQRKRLALLITNIQFEYYLPYRRGAERDEENMEWLLTALGYRVVKYRDLTGQEISARVEDFAARPEHKDSDSTFVVLMSHGDRIQNKDAILGVNYHDQQNLNDVFFVDDIFSSLNSEKCPALRDKPKVILIQASRGSQLGGVKIQSDSAVLVEKDFFCFKSCLPGIVAYRHTDIGSYFICYIVDVFCKRAHTDDIIELFWKVTSRMASATDQQFTSQKKLMPCIDRVSLPKKLYLFPGL